MTKLASLLQAATLVEARSSMLQLKPASFGGNPEMARQIASEVKIIRRRMEEEHLEAAKALQDLLHSNERKARQIAADQEAKRVQEENQAAAAAEKEAAAAQVQKDKEAAAQEQREQEEKQAADKLQAKRDAAAAATEYITRAEKLMKQLVQVRQSVEPFEKSKAVGKRRLGMKKIVNGKVNTLAESVDKIRQVAKEVAQAIQEAKDEDEQLKQEAVGGAAIPPEAMRGKRYLVDLLSSKVIVRVQAEGFNGQRGDGFPLASMLAAVSMETKDLGPVLAAHVYTVCPTAIPTLPHIAEDVSEDELMTKLGMQRGKDGSFETFERFMARTEGVISLVADIMASEPSGHTLMGGHEGAVKWLSRFLGHLPSAPQSPLPLLTAPVLDAFLSGAGHMLANKHPTEFTKLLKSLVDDVVSRLDEGPIGKPSSIRLKKTIEGGFEGFKSKLPSRAMPELYLGANGRSGGTHGGSSTQTTFSTKRPAQSSTQSTASPFGAPSSTTSTSPFGAPSSSTSAPPFGALNGSSASPFGAPSSSSASPFGAIQSTSSAKNLSSGSTASDPAPSPVGAPPQPMQRAESTMMSGMDSAAPAPSPFRATAPTTSPYGVAPTPFGATAAGPSPFGSPAPAPFGASAPSPFGGVAPAPFGAPLSYPSPFGTLASTPFGAPASNLSPFGAPAPSPFGAPASNPSPFGAPAPSPFGAPASNPSPFGAPAPAPFGATAAGPSPFGSPAPAPFGASAPSPFGGVAPAPFGAPLSNPSPFGTPASTPFGAPASNQSPFGAPTPTPFGATATGPSPFGSPASAPFGAPAPSPFGGAALAPFGAPASNPSPFGAPAPSPSPFGASTPSPSPFGAAAPSAFPFGPGSSFGAQASNPSPFGAPAPSPSPFGSGTSGGSDSRLPCKFFAQGRCKYGANCRNSHEAPQSGFGTFGGSSTPFGGPRR